MPLRRPTVPPVRRTLKPFPETSVVTTSGLSQETAEVVMDLWLTGNPNTEFRKSSVPVPGNGNSLGRPATGMVSAGMETKPTDMLKRSVTEETLTSSCLTMARNFNG